MKKNNTSLYMGKSEWDERNGDLLVKAKNWRLFAFLSGLVSLLAVAGVVYIGSQSKIEPYLVTVDRVGTPITVQPIPNMQVDEKVIRYGLADFITNFRTIYPDTAIQKQYVQNTYKYLANFPATGIVSTIYKQNPPVNQENSKQVEVVSVLNTGKDQYQIDWKEKEFDKVGALVATNSYRGMAVIAIIPPTTDAEIMKNPIGLFIKDISFQKTLN